MYEFFTIIARANTPPTFLFNLEDIVIYRNSMYFYDLSDIIDIDDDPLTLTAAETSGAELP